MDKRNKIPDDIDLYEEYKKIKRKESIFSSTIRRLIVEEVEKRLDNNVKKNK